MVPEYSTIRSKVRANDDFPAPVLSRKNVNQTSIVTDKCKPPNHTNFLSGFDTHRDSMQNIGKPGPIAHLDVCKFNSPTRGPI
jgi:hypothetical protein